jgi:hypothetical protein
MPNDYLVEINFAPFASPPGGSQGAPGLGRGYATQPFQSWAAL